MAGEMLQRMQRRYAPARIVALSALRSQVQHAEPRPRPSDPQNVCFAYVEPVEGSENQLFQMCVRPQKPDGRCRYRLRDSLAKSILVGQDKSTQARTGQTDVTGLH